jgi:MFS family permease
MMLGLMSLTGFVRYFEVPYIALQIEKITGSATAAYWTGIISAFVSVGALLSGMLTGYLSDKYKPLYILIPSFVITVITLLIQAYSRDLFVFGFSRTLMYLAGGGVFSVLQKMLTAAAPKRKRGKVFGWASPCSGIGTMAASVAAGGVIYMTNTRGVFYAAALLTFLMIPMAYFMLKKIMEQPFYQINSRKK